MLRKDTGLITWVLTDGKAGDELQALSITEALGQHPGDKAGILAQHSINEPVEFMKFVAT
jgi:hypothetical protein